MSGSETVVVGVLVFVAGQAIQRFVLEPIQDQRRVIGDIAAALLFLGNLGPLSPEYEDRVVLPADRVEASRTIRALGARLRASLWTIPGYRIWSYARIVKPRDTILEASKCVIGWSNSLFSGHPAALRDKIADLLSLPTD